MLPSPAIQIISLLYFASPRLTAYAAPTAAGRSYPIDDNAQFIINLLSFFITYAALPTTDAEPLATTVTVFSGSFRLKISIKAYIFILSF